MKRFAIAMSLALVAGLLMQSPGSASGLMRCPSDGTPSPGSVITGGLVVDGQCILTNVTVKGGIVVEPSSKALGFNFNLLQISGSLVRGGILVRRGSALGLDLDESTGSLLAPSSVTGGIRTSYAVFFDAEKAAISGGFTSHGMESLSFACPGTVCWGINTMCGDRISGQVRIDDDNVGQTFIGDPGEPFFLSDQPCDPTDIHGSLLLDDSNFISPATGEGSEIEGDYVTGTVRVRNSTGEFYGNHVGGSLLCTEGTVVQPPAEGDPSGSTNQVRGRDTCGPSAP